LLYADVLFSTWLSDFVGLTLIQLHIKVIVLTICYWQTYYSVDMDTPGFWW